MFNFHKTELGQTAVKNRNIELNARQRRLLLLIGTEDFKLLNDNLKQRLAPPELIHQLKDMGLIEHFKQNIPLSPDPVVQDSNEIPTAIQPPIEPPEIPHTSAPNSTLNAEHSPALQIHPEPLSFEEIKLLMTDSLRSYCGLMAQQLILRIQATSDRRGLKLCQMQWITSLQESRISSTELNQIYQQINSSLNKEAIH